MNQLKVGDIITIREDYLDQPAGTPMVVFHIEDVYARARPFWGSTYGATGYYFTYGSYEQCEKIGQIEQNT